MTVSRHRLSTTALCTDITSTPAVSCSLPPSPSIQNRASWNLRHRPLTAAHGVILKRGRFAVISRCHCTSCCCSRRGGRLGIERKNRQDSLGGLRGLKETAVLSRPVTTPQQCLSITRSRMSLTFARSRAVAIAPTSSCCLCSPRRGILPESSTAPGSFFFFPTIRPWFLGTSA